MRIFRIEHNGNWHRWFAWRPVWARSETPRGVECRELVWLEFVERKADFDGMTGAFWGWIYAKIPKSLNSNPF